MNLINLINTSNNKDKIKIFKYLILNKLIINNNDLFIDFKNLNNFDIKKLNKKIK